MSHHATLALKDWNASFSDEPSTMRVSQIYCGCHSVLANLGPMRMSRASFPIACGDERTNLAVAIFGSVIAVSVAVTRVQFRLVSSL